MNSKNQVLIYDIVKQITLGFFFSELDSIFFLIFYSFHLFLANRCFYFYFYSDYSF